MNERITIDTPDGSFGAYVARPVSTPAATIVVLQEIFGINADMRSHCDQLAAQGYIAVCPDLFWRLEPGVELTDRSEAEWARAMALYKAFDVEAGVRDIGATMAAARTLEGASGKLGLMGFCAGGLLTFLAAARIGADAAVAYYGGGTNRYLDQFKGFTTPLTIHLAQEDAYIPKAEQEAIIAASADLAHVQVFTYPGQDHAFARVHGMHYNAAAAELASERSERFFARHLG